MFLCLLLDGMTVALTVGLLDVLVFHADASKDQGHAMLAGTVRTARRGDCARTVSGPMTGHDAGSGDPSAPPLAAISSGSGEILKSSVRLECEAQGLLARE